MYFCRRAIALLALFVALSCGCKPTTSTTTTSGDTGPKTNPKDDAQKALGEPDYKVSSRDFIAEFKKDRKAASAKYKDKTVEMTGVLASVGTSFGGDAVLLLESEPMKFDYATCLTTERYPGRLAVPGQTVTVKGRGYTESAALKDVEIVKVEGDKPPSFTADTLA